MGGNSYDESKRAGNESCRCDDMDNNETPVSQARKLS